VSNYELKRRSGIHWRPLVRRTHVHILHGTWQWLAHQDQQLAQTETNATSGLQPKPKPVIRVIWRNIVNAIKKAITI
jgi:hypothetical protein